MVFGRNARQFEQLDREATTERDRGDEPRRFAEKEHSAEWQANTFAAYFLLPDELVEKFNDEELLHIFCGTPRTVVRERLASFREARRASIKRFEGDACNRCGNFTIVRDGNRLKCNTCGLVTGALDVVGSV